MRPMGLGRVKAGSGRVRRGLEVRRSSSGVVGWKSDKEKWEVGSLEGNGPRVLVGCVWVVG